MSLIRPRLGGRTARIQASVHAAVRSLSDGTGHAALTIPMIAVEAGVTPSTIYRRWGDLADLLADVAVQRLRPIADPVDTGTTDGDLLLWVEHYAEEMSSPVGRTMLRDLLSGSETGASQCCGYTEEALQCIADRATQRGETAFSVEDVVDQVIAPIMHRILFTTSLLEPGLCRRLVERALRSIGSVSPSDRA